MRIVMDLNGYRESFSTYLPPALYQLKIDEIELHKGKDTDPDTGMPKTSLKVYGSVIGGEYAGATRVEYVSLTKKARFRLKQFMEAVTGHMYAPGQAYAFDTAQLVGRVVSIDVLEDEPYNGERRSKVQTWLRYDPSGSGAGAVQAAGAPSGLDSLDGVSEFGAASSPGGPVQDVAPAVQQVPVQQPVAQPQQVQQVTGVPVVHQQAVPMAVQQQQQPAPVANGTVSPSEFAQAVGSLPNTFGETQGGAVPQVMSLDEIDLG